MKKFLMLFVLVTSFVYANNAQFNKVEWIVEPYSLVKEYGSDIIVGVGDAKKKNRKLAVKSATIAAYADISLQMSTYIAELFEEYLFEITADDEDVGSVIELAENITRNEHKNRVSGSKIVKRKYFDDGTVAVAVIVSQKKILDTTLAALDKDTKLKDSEEYARFRAENKKEELLDMLKEKIEDDNPAVEEYSDDEGDDESDSIVFE